MTSDELDQLLADRGYTRRADRDDATLGETVSTYTRGNEYLNVIRRIVLPLPDDVILERLELQERVTTGRTLPTDPKVATIQTRFPNRKQTPR